MTTFQEKLQYAVYTGKARLLDSLLSEQSDIDDLMVKFASGREIPLLTALIRREDPERYGELSFPDDLPSDEYTYQHYNDSLPSIEVVLSHGVNPNRYGSIIDAVRVQRQDIIIRLLDYGADPNYPVYDTDTAFSYALMLLAQPQVSLVSAFLDAGGDIHTPNLLESFVMNKDFDDDDIDPDYFTIIDMLVLQGLSPDEVEVGYDAAHGPIKRYIYDTYSPGERLTKLQ